MKNNQKGFSGVEGLLTLVIVGLIAFVGWYVWSTNSKSNQTLTNANKTSESTTASPKIPLGWTSYENKSLGISFAYPKNWSFKDKSTTETSTKSHYVGELTSNEKSTTVAITLIRAKDGRIVSSSIDDWKSKAANLNVDYSNLIKVNSQYTAFSYVNNVNGATSLNHVILAPGNEVELLVLPTETSQKTIIDQIIGTIRLANN